MENLKQRYDKLVRAGGFIEVNGCNTNELAQIAYAQSALIELLIIPLRSCDNAMAYMSEYDIPIMLPTQVKEALQAARDNGYWNENGE